MEYKINEFNITDNKYVDLKGLITCFESSIPLSKISMCNFGPNLIHVKSSENKYPKTKEDRKILKEQVNLILSSLNNKEKSEENNFCFSMSNNINKIYLKRFLSQINSNIHKNKNKDNNEGKQDIKELMSFFEFFSFFTCIKDEFGDEIPLTDYYLSVFIDKNIKYNKLRPIQFNYEYIFHNIINKSNEQSGMNLKNNIHIFYMLLYNLNINDIASYIYCEETKDYFSIFSEEETLDELAKRFFFINQFKILRNDESCKLMAIDEKNNNVENIRYNINAIKNEYTFYSDLYQNYQKIKKYLLITDEDEKKIFGIYFAILLLSEFDFNHDDLFINVIKKNYRELKQNDTNKSLTNIFSQLRSILLSDIRFSSLGSSKKGEKKKILNLLNKLSSCLGIPEDKLFYILLTENINNKEISNKERIISNKFSLFKNIIYFMEIIYIKGIYNILDLFYAYNKKQKLTFSSNKSKKTLNILLMRSNLVYNITFENYLCSKNSYLSIGDNYIDSNSFIIKQNIKEHLYSNYFQEKKNYIYLKNSLSLNFKNRFPKINENEEYLNSVFKDNINFEEILNVYENEICGLLKLVNYGENNTSVHNFNIYDSKGGFNLNHFKAQFNKNISRKNKIEIIDLFNSIEQKNETYIKVSHSFGVFLYDLNQIFGLDNTNNQNIYNVTSNIYKEQNIFKFLEYQPNLNNFTTFKYFQEKTKKIINSIMICKKPIFITCLMELNKFNTLTLFDDMKINLIYVYYSNYYNYILGINDIRQYYYQYRNDFIPNYIKNKDNLTFFRFLTKKFRITLNDYIIYNYNDKKEGLINISKYRFKESRPVLNINANYVFMKNKLSNAFGNDKNISLMMYKYNYSKFIHIFCDKISKSKFNYFIYAINGIKAFVKLTKIYKEKLVLSNVRNLMTDIIVDNYNIIKEEEDTITPINQQIIPKIDNLDELVFDFNKEALGKMLPKLRANIVHLKRIWKDYLYDIIYLINNNSIFYNKECAQLIIEQRMVNFLIILFLFHKNYKFINGESVRKFGVLLSQFIKTVSTEVLKLFLELREEFDIFLSEHDGINNSLNELKSNFENITFEKLITKRIEIQNIINQKIKEKEKNFVKINQQKMREKNLENKDWNTNGGEEIAIIEKNNKFIYEENIDNEPSRNKYKEFSISKKDLYEGRLDNNLRSSKSRRPSSRVIESFNTVNRNSNNNLLQLSHGNSSRNDTPNSEINYNYNQSSEIESNNNYNDANNHKYKYRYSNIALKKVEDVSKVINSKSKKDINENNTNNIKIVSQGFNNINKNRSLNLEINEGNNNNIFKKDNNKYKINNTSYPYSQNRGKLNNNEKNNINNVKYINENDNRRNKENNLSKDKNKNIEYSNNHHVINTNNQYARKNINKNPKLNNNINENKINSDYNDDSNIKKSKLKNQNNETNQEQNKLYNIETEGNNDKNNNKERKRRENNNIDNNYENNININVSENEKNVNDSEQIKYSPTFSKKDFRKDGSKNRIKFNKENDYSFKNTANNSMKNFSQNSFKNMNIQNNINIDNDKQDKSMNNKDSKKSSKKNSNVNSCKKFTNNEEEYENNNKIKKGKNNYISFKNDSQEEEEIEEENNDNDNEGNINLNNFSLFEDEELQKIYQTLSDINELNIEKNSPNNYMTYPMERTNNNMNVVIKEIPINVKKRISTYYRKLEKEKEVRRISEQDDIVPSLKELEKKINQIRKEMNLISINEYYNVKIEQLHFHEIEENKDMNNKLYKMVDELNNEFYNDIEENLKVAQEKINELTL